MSDRVRQDDEIFAGIERLAGTEQFAGKAGVNMLAAFPPVPCRTSTGCPEGSPIVG